MKELLKCGAAPDYLLSRDDADASWSKRHGGRAQREDVESTDAARSQEKRMLYKRLDEQATLLFALDHHKELRHLCEIELPDRVKLLLPKILGIEELVNPPK